MIILTIFSQFGVEETLNFFNSRGLATKEENEGRIFPVSDNALSVLDVLISYMKKGGVKIQTKAIVTDFLLSADKKQISIKLKSLGDVSLIVRDGSSSLGQTAVADIIGPEEAEAMSVVDLIQRVSARPLELKPTSRDSAASQPKSETRTANNYKNWSYDDKGRSNHCDELEKTVKDMGEVQLALANNNFESIVTVDKQRRTYTYQNYEIAFDSVEGLGDFIEVEYIGEDTNVVPQEVAAEMMAFLQRVGCQKIERNYFGYPYLLLPQDRIA